MKYDVFLSYSRKDNEMMRRVRDDLRAAGLRVWTDETLEPGTEVWEIEIEKAIRETYSLVVLMSPDSHDSEWVRNEITLADTLNRRIFPFLIRGEQGESIPLRLISSQRVDARGDYPTAMAQLTTSIRNHMARSNEAPTVKMTRAPRPTPAPNENAEIGKSGVRISLAMGVAATMTVFALVALAVVLASQPPNTPEGTPAAFANTPSGTSENATPTERTLIATLPSFTPTIAGTGRGQIAFVSNRTDPEYDIYLMNADGNRVQLTWTNPYTEAYLAWSAGGEALLFTSWTPPDYAGDIYALQIASGSLTNLTSTVSEEVWGRLSPDGSRVVFAAEGENANVDIWVMNVDSTARTNLTQGWDSWEREPMWSPSGVQIMFASDREGIAQIWVMDADGTNAAALTPADAHFGQAVWSPDGTRIAYARCASPARCNYDEVYGTEDNWDIWVMNANGSDPTQLTTNGTNDLAPSWSSDGTQIAFVSYRDGNAEIYVMNADGSEQANISNNSAEDYGPSWRP